MKFLLKKHFSFLLKCQKPTQPFYGGVYFSKKLRLVPILEESAKPQKTASNFSSAENP